MLAREVKCWGVCVVGKVGGRGGRVRCCGGGEAMCRCLIGVVQGTGCWEHDVD